MDSVIDGGDSVRVHSLTGRMTRATVVACVTGLILVAVSCGGDDNQGAQAEGGQSGKRAAIINVEAITSGDWEPANYGAFQKMVKKWGFEASNVDNVNYDEAESVLARLAQTNDLVIASSAGYGDAVLKTAPKFPSTFFVVFSNLESTNRLPNVAGFSSDWSEAGYLTGAVGCFTANGGKVGHVNSEPIPAFTKFAGGVQQGTEDYCPNGKADYLQTWIRSFTDASKAKQAALQMVNRGATVLTDTADAAGGGVVDAAKEENIKLIMKYVDQSSAAPDNVVTSWLLSFDNQYDRIGELFSKGDLKPQIYEQNFENGGLGVVLPLENADQDANRKTEKVVADLKGGKIQVEDRELLP